MSSKIYFASESDVPEILEFIRDLAKFEKLEHEVEATEEKLRESLFGPRKYAEVIFVEHEGHRAGFALYFHNYSTFLGKPGVYLEDLYVRPEYRGLGLGKALLSFLAKLTLNEGVGGLNGGFWIGIKGPLIFIRRLVRNLCQNGLCIACQVTLSKSLLCWVIKTLLSERHAIIG